MAGEGELIRIVLPIERPHEELKKAHVGSNNKKGFIVQNFLQAFELPSTLGREKHIIAMSKQRLESTQI